MITIIQTDIETVYASGAVQRWTLKLEKLSTDPPELWQNFVEISWEIPQTWLHGRVWSHLHAMWGENEVFFGKTLFQKAINIFCWQIFEPTMSVQEPIAEWNYRICSGKIKTKGITNNNCDLERKLWLDIWRFWAVLVFNSLGWAEWVVRIQYWSDH